METFYVKGMKLRSKLIGAAALICLVVSAGGAIGLYNLKQVMGFAETSHAYVQNVIRMRAIDDPAILKEYQDSYESAGRAYLQAKVLTMLMVVVSLLLLAGVGYYVARTLTRPMNRLVRGMLQAAEGDLTVSVEVDHRQRDEIAEAGGALNILVDEMNQSVRQVALAADAVAVGSQELTDAAEQLSASAQEQASSLEETAASMEEMTSTVKQSADNAMQADKLATESSEAANEGVVMATSIKRSMDMIDASSKKIANITGVIDEIAFQTNLLALNAAVEAARAGEHGRGFAVVASEVRNLAQRSATAAKEIKGLIQDSLEKVGDGNHLVGISGAKLEIISTKVKRVANLVAEISAASQEQASGIDQVNRAIMQMDTVTQTNAAQVEELSSTSQSLASQAEKMKSLVAHFNLGAGTMPDAAAAGTQVAVIPVDKTREGSPVPAKATEGQPAQRRTNVQPLKPKTVPSARTATGSGDWTEF
ncbi:MAG TPA: methyl-accepting chemotaxis protein [Acidiferrobacterales bacterium]|nr:methyl-accepting chemotaxis protein [Acidiferrobacterales bacterium]